MLLALVKPDTVVRWHRAGFRLYWRWISRRRRRDGRRPVSTEIRNLIRQMAFENGHFNLTEHPTADWVVQQLREAFPYDTAPTYLVFDRDSIFSADVVRAVKSIGTKPTRTSYRAPWQNA
jgi:hypothetical protein